MQNVIVAVAIIAILFLSFAAYYKPVEQTTITGYVLLPYSADMNQSNYVVRKAEGLKESNEQLNSR